MTERKLPIGHIPFDELQDYLDYVANLNDNVNNLPQRVKIYKQIDAERDYQDSKRNDRKIAGSESDPDKSISEWVIYIEHHLNKAKENLYYLNDEGALAELRKVAALAVRCMEIYGCPERK